MDIPKGQGDALTLEDYRAMIQSGVNPLEGLEQDAAAQVDMDVQDVPDMEPEEQPEVVNEGEEADSDVEGADSPVDEPEDEEVPAEIPPEQKNAFYKRVQREREKARKEAEEQLRQQFEEQYNPYKKFFDQLGIDPETAMQAIEQQRIQQEAMRLAEQNGWDDEQARWWMEQQKQQQELQELRISVQINDLMDNPEYPGIKSLKPQIMQLMKANPQLSVQQAYWAVGGAQLAQQLKREAEQREIAKRQKVRRTVVSDAQPAAGGAKPLPMEVLAAARQIGLTETEARELMEADFKDLASFRAWKQKKQRRA